MTEESLMQEAIGEARAALAMEEVPVGCVILHLPTDRIIGRGYNRREKDGDPTAHAEIIALREASAALGHWRLSECTAAVTLEPCPMCAGAMVHVRLARVVFGASDPKAGAAGSALNLLQFPTLNHQCAITSGVREQECRDLLQSFFAKQRAAQKTDEQRKSSGGSFEKN